MWVIPSVWPANLPTGFELLSFSSRRSHTYKRNKHLTIIVCYTHTKLRWWAFMADVETVILAETQVSAQTGYFELRLGFYGWDSAFRLGVLAVFWTKRLWANVDIIHPQLVVRRVINSVNAYQNHFKKFLKFPSCHTLQIPSSPPEMRSLEEPSINFTVLTSSPWAFIWK